MSICPTCGRHDEPQSITPKQRELLTFITTTIDVDGFAPSFEEMQKAMGLSSKSGVARLLDCLEERGRITRKPQSARSITVLHRLAVVQDAAE